MRQPKPKCAGYFPKVTKKVGNLSPEWKANERVKEICSVSNCISDGPDGWIGNWKHNDMGFFDTELLAQQEIPDNDIKYDT
jgi:hypothetical protein